MTDIRTPDDEIERPGYFYPPILPGRIYHAATYRGHSDGAIDMNRRTPAGVWMQDLGDPVLAAAGGEVSAVVPRDGAVMIDHAGGYRTEYRHMQDIRVKPGQKVERGDQIGEVGDVAGSGSSFGPHLHFRVHRNGRPVQVEFEGKPVRTSVINSDSKPVGWEAPDPVEIVGPPARATWQSAAREAIKRLERTEAKVAAKNGLIDVLTGERNAALADLSNALVRIAELEARPPADCTEVETALATANEKITKAREALA